MQEKLEKLQWYLDMGVDETICELALNNVSLPQKAIINNIEAEEIIHSRIQNNLIGQKETIYKSVTMPNTAKQLISPASTISDTRKMADEANNLIDLRSMVMTFDTLSIAKTATNTVFADGTENAKIMLIGEAPGAEEDAQGIPFCGASGQLLDQMLNYIGLQRKNNFYITNTIFWRPPGNRRPTPEELAICLPFVEKHIALINPNLIILVGGTAVSSLLDSKQGITQLRGKFFKYNNRYLKDDISITAIFHPSYLLRSPGQKKVAWKDLLNIEDYITNNIN